jgi:cytochrome P450
MGSYFHLSLLCLVASVLYAIYIVCYAIYNLYFHPLHGFPGQKLWIAFPILRHIAAIRGRFDERTRVLHEMHGPVVRTSPDELSFITAQAWKDIYGHGHIQFPKWIAMPNREASIISANDSNHARFRKALSHAFSGKALRDQEPLMNTYIDLVIEKMKDVASGQKTDVVKWYNLTTFDMIGDLAFGASFDGLKNNEYHSWVSIIFGSIKIISFFRMANEYPLVMKVVMSLMPKSLMESTKHNIEFFSNTTMKRINNQAMNGRGDFMDSMLKRRGEKDGLTDQELIANAFILIIAGSETTATLLSGVTYWLLQTPEALRKVTEEVRVAFKNESDINFINASARLPYMLACLEEGLRRYPPVPSGLQRIVPPGEAVQISGYQIPEKVSAPAFHSIAIFLVG